MTFALRGSTNDLVDSIDVISDVMQRPSHVDATGSVGFTRATLDASANTSYGHVSVCVCLSVTSRCSVEVVGRIKLVFGTEASFDKSYTVLKGNSSIFENKGTSMWKFVPKSGLGKCCFDISIVETCYQRSSRKVDAQIVTNWTVVEVDNTSELRRSSTSYHSNRQALSTAQVRRAGQLATADSSKCKSYTETRMRS